MSDDRVYTKDLGSSQVVFQVTNKTKVGMGSACHDNCSSVEGQCIATSMLAWLSSKDIKYDFTLNT